MNVPSEVSLEDAPCPMGCARSDTFVLRGRDVLYGLPGEYTVVRCNQCGLMRTNPRPTAETIGFYYPSDYGPYVGTTISPKAQQPAWKRFLRKVLDSNSQRIPDMPVGHMLEFGCASGSYLQHMSQQGWSVEGIEFSESAAKTAREAGFHVYQGSLESAPPPSKVPDLITAWMVLEHLHSPIECLKKLRGWTHSGTRFVFSVPQAEAPTAELFGGSWYPLHLPAHLYHYSPKTLAMVLERSGWEIEKILYQKSLVDPIASVGMVLSERGLNTAGDALVRLPGMPLVSLALWAPAAVLAQLQLTSRMTVWARPRKSGSP